MALIAVLALTGCAGSVDRYPSLAIRDVERVSGVFAPVDPAGEIMQPAAAPAGEQAHLQDLAAQADAAHQDFLSAVPNARALVASIDDRSPGSNQWAVAQVALADLDSQRSRAAIALGDLDLLYAQATTDFVERAAIAEVRRDVVSNIQTEDAILAELRAKADQ